LTENPVLRALQRAKLDGQLAEWVRKEALVSAAVIRRLGNPPAVDQSAGTTQALDVFKNWCDRNTVRCLPAQPTSVAQFVLDSASHGVRPLAETLGSISEAHSSLGLANPVATWIVAAALERAGDVPPPRSWPRPLKALFALLPPTLKVYVADHDTQREKVVRRAQNEAARAKHALAAIQGTARSNQNTMSGDPNGKQEPQ